MIELRSNNFHKIYKTLFIEVEQLKLDYKYIYDASTKLFASLSFWSFLKGGKLVFGARPVFQIVIVQEHLG